MLKKKEEFFLKWRQQIHIVIHSNLSSLCVCIRYATIHSSTINTWAMRFFFAFVIQEFDSIFKEWFRMENTYCWWLYFEASLRILQIQLLLYFLLLWIAFSFLDALLFDNSLKWIQVSVWWWWWWSVYSAYNEYWVSVQLFFWRERHLKTFRVAFIIET